MHEWNLTRPAFDRLVQHLIDLEECRYPWLENNFKYLSPEREQISNLLDEYIKKLNLFITTLTTSTSCSNNLPFVIMGSKVTLFHMEREQEMTCRILPIYQERAGNGDVSILSPLGNSLILKEAGSEFSVEAPRGVTSFRIVSIVYEDCE